MKKMWSELNKYDEKFERRCLGALFLIVVYLSIAELFPILKIPNLEFDYGFVSIFLFFLIIFYELEKIREKIK